MVRSVEDRGLNLLIVGAGAHGRVVFETAQALGSFRRIDFLDDVAITAIDKIENGLLNYRNDFQQAFVALGQNDLRKHWFYRLREVGYEVPSLIHPNAYVSASAKLAAGVVVLPNAVVHTNARVDLGSIIGIGGLIDHDAIVEAFCHIDSGCIVPAYAMVPAYAKLKAGVVYSGSTAQYSSSIDTEAKH
ncbi:MAG TPA: PglB [Clostridiaceae bacterium]|nr:PglB [Clostridiaceae bacterium]